jgi:hypothetical protein
MGERTEADLFLRRDRILLVPRAWLLCIRRHFARNLVEKRIVPTHDWLTAAAIARFCISSGETSSLCVAIVH